MMYEWMNLIFLSELYQLENITMLNIRISVSAWFNSKARLKKVFLSRETYMTFSDFRVISLTLARAPTQNRHLFCLQDSLGGFLPRLFRSVSIFLQQCNYQIFRLSSDHETNAQHSDKTGLPKRHHL